MADISVTILIGIQENICYFYKQFSRWYEGNFTKQKDIMSNILTDKVIARNHQG